MGEIFAESRACEKTPGDRYIEETNWCGDTIWRVYRGEGQNLLGKILMDVCSRLSKERAAAPGKAQQSPHSYWTKVQYTGIQPFAKATCA